jgi:hypothetical protein
LRKRNGGRDDEREDGTPQKKQPDTRRTVFLEIEIFETLFNFPIPNVPNQFYNF